MGVDNDLVGDIMMPPFGSWKMMDRARTFFDDVECISRCKCFADAQRCAGKCHSAKSG